MTCMFQNYLIYSTRGFNDKMKWYDILFAQYFKMSDEYQTLESISKFCAYAIVLSTGMFSL